MTQMKILATNALMKNLVGGMARMNILATDAWMNFFKGFKKWKEQNIYNYSCIRGFFFWGDGANEYVSH